MKRSVWIVTGAGLLATVTALLIEINYIILQTEPTAPDTIINGVSTVLLITGAVLFAEAYWELKQKINRVLAFILIAIGLVGVGGFSAFYNTLVDVFFPKLSIISFLLTDFTVIALFGFFLLIFGRLPLSNEKQKIHS